MADLLPNQRRLFDIPDDIAYFNCAYNGPMLRRTADALVAGARSKQHPWKRSAADFFDMAEEVRHLAASALGGSSDCYAVVPSASYGASAVARLMEGYIGQGDEIIVLAEAFPSNYLPWKRLADAVGATLITAQTPTDFDWAGSVESALSSRTKLVAVDHCHWTNGVRLDLDRISYAARSAGAAIFLDLSQSLGAYPLDFESIQPDFVVAAGYKWLLCPYGFSVFYAAEKWHGAAPLEESWLGRAGAEKFESLVDYTDDYQPGARRFDMGQKAIPTLLPGAADALRQIGAWGVANISETLGTVTDQIASRLSDFGLVPVPKQSRMPHLLGARRSEGLPDTLVSSLAQHNIYISRRGNSLRFAPYLHITPKDLDRLFDGLEKALS